MPPTSGIEPWPASSRIPLRADAPTETRHRGRSTSRRALPWCSGTYGSASPATTRAELGEVGDEAGEEAAVGPGVGRVQRHVPPGREVQNVLAEHLHAVHQRLSAVELLVELFLVAPPGEGAGPDDVLVLRQVADPFEAPLAGTSAHARLVVQGRLGAHVRALTRADRREAPVDASEQVEPRRGLAEQPDPRQHGELGLRIGRSRVGRPRGGADPLDPRAGRTWNRPRSRLSWIQRRARRPAWRCRGSSRWRRRSARVPGRACRTGPRCGRGGRRPAWTRTPTSARSSTFPCPIVARSTDGPPAPIPPIVRPDEEVLIAVALS